MTLRAVILGAAAGGGLPQWNCGCLNCDEARAGRLRPRTQSSVAVSADGRHWAILNASPDIREQLARTPALHPTSHRNSPLRAVLLTNGDIDHVAGLLTLREKQTFTLFATQSIHTILAANAVFDALDPEHVSRVHAGLNAPFELVPGLNATLFSVPGKVPLYLEGGIVDTTQLGEDTVGVELCAAEKRLLYIPGCAAMTDPLRARLTRADLVLFDGTLWTDDEMIVAGLGQKTGRRMGHMPISGPDSSLDAFAQMDVGQKVFIHMNNTNPIWRDNSAPRAQAEAAGWIIGDDGMEFLL